MASLDDLKINKNGSIFSFVNQQLQFPPVAAQSFLISCLMATPFSGNSFERGTGSSSSDVKSPHLKKNSKLHMAFENVAKQSEASQNEADSYLLLQTCWL
jgi:hypothetical protein